MDGYPNMSISSSPQDGHHEDCDRPGLSPEDLGLWPQYLGQEVVIAASEKIGKNRYPRPGTVAINRGLRQSS